MLIRNVRSSDRIRDIVIVAMALYLVAQHALPPLLARAQQGEPSAQIASALTESFAYQGRFEQDGIPVTGAFDFEFSLYGVATGGAPLVTLLPLTSVPVTNGLFTVQLGFDATWFQGEQRWLNVRVRPNAQALFTQLARQELSATPYALYAKTVAFGGDGTATTAARSDHNHLGEAWESGDFYRALQVTSTNESVGASTIFGVTTGEFTAALAGEASNGGVGISGTALPRVGDTTVDDRNIGVVGRSCNAGSVCAYQDNSAAGSGVYGESLSGVGVYGIGTVDSGGPTTAGVVGEGLYGVAGSGTALGVIGSSDGSGVAGYSRSLISSTFFPEAGVLGFNNSTACSNTDANLEQYCAGVYGEARAGVAGIGVYGFGSRVGVYGDAPAGQFAIYANGDIFATGAYLPSDAKLKTDAAEGAGLNEILALSPKSYRWATADLDDGKRHEGLFAQDVLAVLPDLVTYIDGQGEPHYAMNYIELIPVLIRAIQEQQAIIESLGGQQSLME